MLAIMDDDWGVGPQDHKQSGCLQRLDLLALEDAAPFFCSQRGAVKREERKEGKGLIRNMLLQCPLLSCIHYRTLIAAHLPENYLPGSPPVIPTSWT